MVGSDPNGLAAALVLPQAGLSVLLIEGKNELGGGLCTAELTLPGFRHDICSAIHPLTAASPYFQTLPLAQYGLEYLTPAVAAAHPFDDGTAAVVHFLADTARSLGSDADAYQRQLAPLIASWSGIANDVLARLHLPRHPLDMARFGLPALLPATGWRGGFGAKKPMAYWPVWPPTPFSRSAILPPRPSAWSC